MSLIAITEDNGHAIINPKERLGYEVFQKYRACIEGAKYDGERKLNYAPLDKLPAILKRLRESDFDVELSPEIAERLREHTAQQWIDLRSAQDRLKRIEDELAKRGLFLRPYQRSGVQWLATRTGAVLADEMGLGKTLQAILALPANSPVLIVCPSVAKGVWRRELKKWGRPDLKPTVLSGRGSFKWPAPGEVVIANYDILPECHKMKMEKVKGKDKLVKACEPFCEGCLSFLDECADGTVILADEAHALKNAKSQRTIKFRALGAAVRVKGGRTWLLTATPLLNRPQELWSIYQAAGVAQEAFGSWKGFLEVMNGHKGMWGGFEWGTPMAEAGERIRRVCLRRLRAEVAKDIPTKTWQEYPVEVDRATLKKCDEVLKEYGGIDHILELVEEGTLDFETLSSVRHALALAKIPALLELVEQYEEQDEPLVVFSAHRGVVEELMKREGWAGILGGVSAEERTRIEDDFQNGKLKGIACTIQAGGVAITLTRSHIAIFADREWTPALNAQAEDRICRMGQTVGCLIVLLVANHILDERITALLLQKQELIAGSVDAARVIEAEKVDILADSEYEDMIRRHEEEIAHAAKPKEPRPKPNKYRPAITAQEKWAGMSLLTLADLDPDGASVENGVGFNKVDGGFGHSLALQFSRNGGLSEKQWPLAIQLCKKYKRQVGECPEEG